MVRGKVAIALWAILGWGCSRCSRLAPNGEGRLVTVASLRISFPPQWPEKLKRLWQVEVGVGHSSPLVVNGGIYLHSATRRPGSCPPPGSQGRQHGVGRPKSLRRTPCIPQPWLMAKDPSQRLSAHQGRLFTLGISGRVSAFELESGKLLWRHDFAEEFAQTSPLFGVAMSPLVEAGC